jgi:hypothetical protein
MNNPLTGRGRRITAVGCASALALSGVLVTSTAAAAKPARGTLAISVSSARAGTVKVHVNGASFHRVFAVHVRAGHTASVPALHVAPGRYRVVEAAASGTYVSGAGVSPHSRMIGRHTKAGWVSARVLNHATTHVSFHNRAMATQKPPTPAPDPNPTPPTGPSDPGTGYIEVCKAAGDGFVTGTVTVNIAAGATHVSQPVPVGQCTDAIQVPVGTATVTETVSAPYFLAAARVSPRANLVDTNLPAGQVRVKVKESADGSTETLVTLVNRTHRGQFKVCKTLTANAGDLITNGQNAFTFDVSYTALNSNPYRTTITVVVPTLEQAACVLYPARLPLGTQVTITEEAAPNTTLQSITVLPASQNDGVSGSSVTLTLGPNPNGITTATFTNSADGTVEICKNIDDAWMPNDPSRTGGSPFNGTPFQFKVNGGDPITVDAGACSRAISVPAGTATVEELTTDHFFLESMTAEGPRGENRLVSGTNPITVSVPAGGVGNETLVTATNKVDTGRVKVCKELGPTVPAGKTYSFEVTYHLKWDFSEWLKLTPTGQGPDGEVCSYLSHPLPVIDPAGNPTKVTVTEGPSPFGIATNPDGSKQLIVEPTSITYDGNGSVVASKTAQPGDPISFDGTYFLCAELGFGVNEITFLNDFVVDP